MTVETVKISPTGASREGVAKFAPLAVTLLALAVLAGSVVYGSRHLETALRQQMVERDGDLLYAVTQARQFGGGAKDLASRLQDPGEQFLVALEISQLRDGVMAVRLFDADGNFVVASPLTVTRAKLAPDLFSQLKKLHPASMFRETAPLSELFLVDPVTSGPVQGAGPLLEVNVPLHARNETELLGIAQLIVDGHDLLNRMHAMRRQLSWNAAVVFAAGGSLLTIALVWAFRRLHRSNLMLIERSERLLRANHELTLAAKTGALGAVTAHLIHGLSNPLANLQQFVAARVSEREGNEEWDDALAATRRMQELVHEVVRVLGERGTDDSYEITVAELGTILRQRTSSLAQKLSVTCLVETTAEGRLTNHQANIILLILENLIHNALQVTPAGRAVKVALSPDGRNVACRVKDEGPGFPATSLKDLFSPCRSTKGGAGLGLAISKQLAAHLGAELELVRSTTEGSEITLNLPAAIFCGAARPILGATANAN